MFIVRRTTIDMSERVGQALRVAKETRESEFKQTFDPGSLRDWCELLKDIFALANSGGGVIVFGLNNDGQPAGVDVSSIASLDPARIADKIDAYTGVHFDDFELVPEAKGGQPVMCLILHEAEVPLIPRRPGTYPAADGKGQERAFSAGVLYMRHGAKSEPASSSDLRKLIGRRVATATRDVLRNVRRVVDAPAGAKVDILVPAKRIRAIGPGRSTPQEPVDQGPPMAVQATISPNATPVRITSDPTAAPFRLVDPDQTHPYRMVDLLKEVNSRLESLGRSLSPYDIHSMDYAHGVFSRIDFSYKAQYGPRKYSLQFVEWLVEQMKRNPDFHLLARAKRRRLKRGMR